MPDRICPGEAVWCAGSMNLPYGARLIGEAGDGRWWLDVCVMGQFLPQMYRPAGFWRLPAGKCEGLGLCWNCLGYGTTAGKSRLWNIGRGCYDAENPDACPSCGGSGRPCIRATYERSAGSTVGNVTLLPHTPVIRPRLRLRGVARGLCLACGEKPGGKVHAPAAV